METLTKEKTFTITLTKDELLQVRLALRNSSNSWDIDALKASNKKDYERAENSMYIAKSYRDISRNITKQKKEQE